MLNKVIQSYFKSLQELLNPFQVYFDTAYNLEIDSLKQAMSNYNLRQIYNFDAVKTAGLTDDTLIKLRTERPGGGSYNILQYRYEPIKHHEQLLNNQSYSLVYDTATDEAFIAEGQRKYHELPVNDKQALKALFDNDSVKELVIHEVVAGDILPFVDPKPPKPSRVERLGFWGETTLNCRFTTHNSSLFEDLMILYNSLLYKRNPPAKLDSKAFKDKYYPITTKYSEIGSAGQLSAQNGNLLYLEFSVTLSTFFLTNFVRYGTEVNRVVVGFEVRKNKRT